MRRSIRFFWGVLSPSPIAVALIGAAEILSGRGATFASWAGAYLIYAYLFGILPSAGYAALMEWHYAHGLPTRSLRAIGLSAAFGSLAGLVISLIGFAASSGVWAPLPLIVIGGATGLIVAAVTAIVPQQKEEGKEAEPGATDNPDDAQRLREDH